MCSTRVWFKHVKNGYSTRNIIKQHSQNSGQWFALGHRGEAQLKWYTFPAIWSEALLWAF